jgi:hypothetical protein
MIRYEHRSGFVADAFLDPERIQSTGRSSKSRVDRKSGTTMACCCDASERGDIFKIGAPDRSYLKSAILDGALKSDAFVDSHKPALEKRGVLLLRSARQQQI